MFWKNLKDYIKEKKRQRLVRQRVIKFQKKINQSKKHNDKMRRKKLILSLCSKSV